MSGIDQKIAVAVEMADSADVSYDLVFVIDPRQSAKQTWPQFLGIYGTAANLQQEAIEPFVDVSQVRFDQKANTLNIVTMSTEGGCTTHYQIVDAPGDPGWSADQTQRDCN
jgi:hypothetical protein